MSGERIGSTSINDQIRNTVAVGEHAFITTYLNGLPSVLLLDSGSPYTAISRNTYYKIPKQFRPPLQSTQLDNLPMADGKATMKVIGEVTLPVKVYGEQFTYAFLVVVMDRLDGILGSAFSKEFDCFARPSVDKIYFRGVPYPWNRRKHELLGHAVHLIRPVTISPGEECVTKAAIYSPFKQKEQVVFEPSPFCRQTYGILPANTCLTQGKRSKTTAVQLTNSTEDSVTLPKGTIVGHVFPANSDRTTVLKTEEVKSQPFPLVCDKHKFDSTVCQSHGDRTPRSVSVGDKSEDRECSPRSGSVSDNRVFGGDPVSPCSDSMGDNTVVSCTPDCFTVDELELAVPDHLDDLYERSSKSLNKDERKKLAAVLIRTGDTFAKNHMDMGVTHLAEHKIDTGDARPFREPLRRHGPLKEKAIKNVVTDCLSKGIMAPSVSPWANAPVVTWKPDNTPRFCLDFRRLNQLVKFDCYPLPRFEDCIDSLHGSKYYCSLDLQAGYWQIPLRSQDKEKTAFLTKDGLFQFEVMPFGLNNAGATFERLMENVLRGYQWSRCLVYLDDILIYAASFDQALENLELVLNRLSAAGLKLKPRKCNLMQESLVFLGHRISAKGIEPMENKVSAVRDWPSLGTVPRARLRAEAKKFLGLVSYYRMFIKGMSTIASPIYALMKADSDLVWTPECEAAFVRLKAALTSAPVLSYPDIQSDGFVLDCDASDTGLGVVLSQVQHGQERLLGYYSKLLSDSERNYCVTKREFLAVVKGVQNFRPYLYGQRFLIRTDNAAVSHMLHLTDSQPQIQRWQLFLSQFKFDIVRRPGHLHGNADTMSRMVCVQCGREEDPPKQPVKGKPRKLHKKPSSDVPPCEHTRDTDTSIDEEVEDLMMACAVMTRAQARAGNVATDPDSNINTNMNLNTDYDINLQDSLPIPPNMETSITGSGPNCTKPLVPGTFSYENLREL